MSHQVIKIRCPHCDAQFRADFAPERRMCDCPRCLQGVIKSLNTIDPPRGVISSEPTQRRRIS